MLYGLVIGVVLTVVAAEVAGATEGEEAKGAASTAAPRSFFEQRQEGWFWYWDPRVEEDETESDPPPRDPAALFEWLKTRPVEELDLDRLPTVELKALLQAKREWALDDPTPARVREYFLVHRAVFRRADRFTRSWELALIREPELDSHSRLPVSQLGQTIRTQVEVQERQSLLRRFAERGGLFFFFTSTCPYCQAQSQILKRIEKRTGITVFPITRDGYPLPEYPEARPDNGMGEQLGVAMVPMLFLAIPEEQFITPLGAGLLTESDVLRRIQVVLEARAQERGIGAEPR